MSRSLTKKVSPARRRNPAGAINVRSSSPRKLYSNFADQLGAKAHSMPAPTRKPLARYFDLGGSRLLDRIRAIIFAREAPYDRAQPWFVDLFRRLRGRAPLDDPLLFFGPLFALTPDLQQKHAHVTDDDPSILQALFIRERAD